jgi:hypothetical protein
MSNKSLVFFETQFGCQITSGEYAFNPLEQTAARFVSGRAHDLNRSLGSLIIEVRGKAHRSLRLTLLVLLLVLLVLPALYRLSNRDRTIPAPNR